MIYEINFYDHYLASSYKEVESPPVYIERRGILGKWLVLNDEGIHVLHYSCPPFIPDLQSYRVGSCRNMFFNAKVHVDKSSALHVHVFHETYPHFLACSLRPEPYK